MSKTFAKKRIILLPKRSRNSAAVAIERVSRDLFPPGETSATFTNLKMKFGIGAYGWMTTLGYESYRMIRVSTSLDQIPWNSIPWLF